MTSATYKDKEIVVDILSKSFDDNKSVNYIVPQDKRRGQRIKRLMEYSFDICYHFGKVMLSDDRKACALIVIPEKKKTTVQSIFLDLKLMFTCMGLSNVSKAMSREAKIRKAQPKEPMYYLWFIGVHPSEQGTGIGSGLLNEIVRESESEARTICLETSTLKNLPWYERFGFRIYNELDLGYKLFFLKRRPG
jgi:ribosomal protein S18 acetylase RimI-like enzyme